MAKITEKLKQKITGVKDKAKGTADKTTSKAKEGVSSSSTTTKSIAHQQDRQYEEGGRGTHVGRKDDPLTEYREKEPMTPAKIKEHEPTAVNREMTEKITEAGKEVPSPEAAKEIARRSGMAKGTADAAGTGSEYEHGASGTNT
jgi:3-mercaptopyruvate sulfurtransferase SseA